MEPLTRRQLIQAGTASLLSGIGLSALRPAPACATPAFAPAKAAAVILLWLEGGPSHLDTFDPKHHADAAIRGPFGTISTCVPDIQICEHLPRLARQMDKIVLLRGVSHGEGGHERARHYLQTGFLPTSTRTYPTYAETMAERRAELVGEDVTANCRKARRLVANGTRFVTVTMPGWDTHEDNFPRLRNQLLPTLDRALSTLLRELHERGMLETTLVVCMGEFGRSPIINKNALPGRDHWPNAMTVVLAGGGVPGGQVIGATDAWGMNPACRAIRVEEVAATIYSLTGAKYVAETAPLFQNG